MTDSIIVTDRLCYSYRAGARQKDALVDITLEIARGSCLAIIGVTGSGKSTLVQHFNGLLRPTAGTIMVEGVDLSAPGINLITLRQRVGLLFQFAESQLFAPTVFADVAFGPQRMGLSQEEVRVRVQTALEIVGLSYHTYAQRSPFELSGGQMRRVALAGVLAMLPTILVLDEPTTGLDATGRAEFHTYLHRVQQERGVTIVLVSHDLAEVASLADSIIVLHEGRLVAQGTPRSIFSQSERLRTWGLVAPPLSMLLARLREQGLAVPSDILTLDEAIALFQKLYQLPRSD